MSEITFTRAKKEHLKARISLDGPSGSGKTYTGLTIARALAGPLGRIGGIDTQRGQMLLFADEFEFDYWPMSSYEPERLVEVLAAAGEQKLDVVLIDSMTHFWSGAGGMLEQVDQAGVRDFGGNKFGGWKAARPMERRMLAAILAYPGHVIVTMRVKADYVVQLDPGTGKQKPVRVGLKPEQRDGLEYEFDITASLDQQHTLTVTKARSSKLADRVIDKPGPEFGEEILAWLADGATAMPTVRDYQFRAQAPEASSQQLRDLYAEVHQRGMLGAALIDGTGQTRTLGELIGQNGKEARAREERARQEGAAA